jgi:hypothetical protein
MAVATLRRAASTATVTLGVLALGLSAAAFAAPTLTLKTTALPIPGFPGTGNILGAGAVIRVEGTVSGSEYGGFPPPVTEVRFYGPATAKLRPQGFATCAPSVIEQRGPGACPRKSIAGPKGSASAIVSFGTERVPETASVQPFFAPGGALEFFADGHTPVLVEILSKGSLTNAAPPFGPEVDAEVPLVESVPGALDASELSISVEVGAAYRRAGKTVSYVTVPATCPHGGLSVKAVVSFLGGATAEAAYKMPCPRKAARS